MFDPRQAPVGPYELLYDEECGVCRATVRGVLRLAPHRRIRPVGLRTERAAEMLPDLTTQERLRSFHVVAPTGERWSGPDAIPHVLAELPSLRAAARLIRASATLQRATASAYWWVTRNRGSLARYVPQRWKRPVGDDAAGDRPGYHERPGGSEEG